LSILLLHYCNTAICLICLVFNLLNY
jgi:hypothetical protein